MHKLLLISLTLLSVTTTAQVEVSVVKGRVLNLKKTLKKGDILQAGNLIRTGKSSLCKLTFKKSGASIVLGPESALKIKSPDKKAKPGLIKGALRYFNSKKSDQEPTLYTKQVSAGVRGTDFMLVANPLLGETEIVMFDGEVLLKNLATPRDKLDVKGGQWGGLGGRFGSKFQKPIDLPENVIKVFRAKIQKL